MIQSALPYTSPCMLWIWQRSGTVRIKIGGRLLTHCSCALSPRVISVLSSATAAAAVSRVTLLHKSTSLRGVQRTITSLLVWGIGAAVQRKAVRWTPFRVGQYK